jgi:hypothetical protein
MVYRFFLRCRFLCGPSSGVNGASGSDGDTSVKCENPMPAENQVDRVPLHRIFPPITTVPAPLAELVDALDSKSSSERSAGSIPAWGTTSSSTDVLMRP